MRQVLRRGPRILLAFALLLAWVQHADARTAPRLREPDWSRVSGVEAPPAHSARSVILVDVDSRTVLYASNPDLVLPPASLTKLVAIDVALVAAARGEFSLETTFVPPEVSWAERQPAGSSLMFLGPGQELSLDDLLTGLAVPSGNDAAVALATILDGSVPAFAERMNARMQELGLVDLFFVEPSGLSPQNSVTARSFARFLLAHLAAFPEVTGRYYARQTYTYPQARHRVSPAARTPVTQANRNLLLWDFDGVDGLKTGYIGASGYHLAATAERDGRRLLVLVLGLDADSHALGGTMRAAEAAAFLEYGFRSFERLRLGYPPPDPVRVFRGQASRVEPVGPAELVLAVPAGQRDRIVGFREQAEAVVAPLPAMPIGRVGVRLDGVELASERLYLPEQELGGIWRRIRDGVLLFFRELADRVAGRERPTRSP